MSLIFGRLGQSFVDFGMTMATPNPSPEQYRQAAENLKSDASRLPFSWYTLVSPLPSSLFHNFATVPSPHAHVFLKGIGIWFTTYIYMATWVLTDERNAKRIRETYILQREVAYFDTSGGTGEAATRIERDTRKQNVT